jgi:hypothetical protein
MVPDFIAPGVSGILRHALVRKNKSVSASWLIPGVIGIYAGVRPVVENIRR